MSEPGTFAKRAIASIYSHAANRLYEPVVVNRAFPLFGGDLHDKVRALGRQAVEAAGNDPILDLPVGTAYFTVDAARHHSGLIVGSDIAGGMVQRTHQVAREQRTPNLVAVQADAHHLPFPDATFGAILCINGLQVMPNLQATLKEFRRALKPTGTLYVSLITAPLEAALPKRVSAHLPTLLRSREKVLQGFQSSGFEISHLETQRLAYWFEATPHP